LSGQPRLRVHVLDRDLPPPLRSHDGDAGLDLRARVEAVLRPGERAAIPTGVAVGVPPSHCGFVVPRSGLARHQGITLANSPGLIDQGYRGEVVVVLVNLDPQMTHAVHRGDRIAQLVVVPIVGGPIELVDDLDATLRGASGFGSSGRA
jgi:dUTP diphosphatase